MVTGMNEQKRIEDERAELEAVASALTSSPRLHRLLRYIGERYFAGQEDQLLEYNIATEVFGRSKTAFDSGRDAIARVETHRLRKRLKEYYAGEGLDHKLHLMLPPGSYAPVFITPRREEVRAESEPEVIPPDQATPLAAPPAESPARIRAALRNPFVWALFSLCLILIAVGIYHFLRHHEGTSSALSDSTTTAPQQNGPPGSLSGPVRIMCGYQGNPRTDSAGRVWEADKYFNGGGNWRRPDTPVARTSDPLLFEYWRTGDFAYDIPLKPGTYELHLYFVTNDENLETFSVSLNGQPLLRGFSVNADALGSNIADERVFHDVSPARDGYMHLDFTSERAAPALSAIEILPGTPHKMLPLRMPMQQVALTDHQGNLWRPDSYYMNGILSNERHTLTGTSDPDLFASERYGHFTYALPADPRDRYTLILHFAEFYYGSRAASGGEGNRVFHVMANGQMLLENFDIYKEGGSMHSLTKSFSHLRPTSQGKINLTFEPVTNNATISGIELIDEGQ